VRFLSEREKLASICEGVGVMAITVVCISMIVLAITGLYCVITGHP
jgi:hypothetical protein